MEIIKQGKIPLMKVNYEIEQQREHECKVCGCIYGFYDDECSIVMTRKTVPFFSKDFVRYEKRALNKEYHICCPNCQTEDIYDIKYTRLSFYKEKKGTDDEWEEVGFLTGRHIYMDYLARKKEERLMKVIGGY